MNAKSFPIVAAFVPGDVVGARALRAEPRSGRPAGAAADRVTSRSRHWRSREPRPCRRGLPRTRPVRWRSRTRDRTRPGDAIRPRLGHPMLRPLLSRRGRYRRCPRSAWGIRRPHAVGERDLRRRARRPLIGPGAFRASWLASHRRVWPTRPQQPDRDLHVPLRHRASRIGWRARRRPTVRPRETSPR